jgi:hypothetical protein
LSSISALCVSMRYFLLYRKYPKMRFSDRL